MTADKKTEAIEKPKLLATMADRLGVEHDRMLSILKNTVIKPTKGGKEASMEEIQAFLIVANKYDLNPITKEIYAFESNGAVVPIVGVDGWSTLVNRQPDFDGCEFEVSHDDSGKLVSISCTIYHKQRTRPIVVTEFLSECKRNSVPWNTMPSRMLRHKAFIQCARLAFGLSGLHDEDEALDIIRNAAPAKQVSRSKLNDTQQPMVITTSTGDVEPEYEASDTMGDDTETNG